MSGNGWRGCCRSKCGRSKKLPAKEKAWSALYLAVQHWQEVRLRERQLLLAESLDCEVVSVAAQAEAASR